MGKSKKSVQSELIPTFLKPYTREAPKKNGLTQWRISSSTIVNGHIYRSSVIFSCFKV